jgi:predicted Zn-dependent protease with MMP-like domain
MEIEKFEELVAEAVNGLPEHILKAVNNTAIVVEEKAPSRTLLGLYEGIPENVWGKGMGMNLPDKITIFKNTIERVASSPAELKEAVKIVVWHEIAHHFGFDEAEVDKLEKKWRKKQKNQKPNNAKKSRLF